MSQLLHATITNIALRAYYTVFNAHPHDYPESFYEEMMQLELDALGAICQTQVRYTIKYKNVKIGVHITDVELGNAVVLELKVQPQLRPPHEAQLISNLKISKKQVGLLLNFGGEKPEYRRKVFTGITDLVPIVWDPKEPDANLIEPALAQMLRTVVWTVYHELGAGFVHRVYVNATHVELRQQQIAFQRFRKLKVLHRGREIGMFTFHHFVIDNRILLAPVTVAMVGVSEVRKVRSLLHQYNVSLGMIVNFQNEKLEVMYVKK